jgi:hypothetical protein
MERSLLNITEADVVCDLPYPLECGLWFDHHEGNFQALQYRNIDPSVLPGRFDLKPSCARVVFDFFGQEVTFPSWYEETVAEADIIDSFNYSSIEEWRRETPGGVIDKTLKISDPSLQERNAYMRNLVFQIRDHSLEEVARLPMVKKRLANYKEEELRMTKIIQQSATFLPADREGKMVILDLTGFKRRPDVVKNLAFLIFPQALSVLEVHNLHDRGVKTNHLSFSLSLSLNGRGGNYEVPQYRGRTQGGGGGNALLPLKGEDVEEKGGDYRRNLSGMGRTDLILISGGNEPTQDRL